MAKIIPFKAVRPKRDKVGLVASRSYQSYTRAQREARLRDNPFSFLHIINPGYRYAKTIAGKARYNLVRNRYLEFKEDEIFIEDASPCYYIYKIIDRDGQEFNGIIAAASAEDYENNIIKKHEDTIEKREVIFKEYLKTVGFNAEPVLLTYPDNSNIEKIIEICQLQRSEYEFTTTHRDTHYLWCVCDKEHIEIIKNEFEQMPSIYIADGHHRCSSSYLLYKDEVSKNESYKYFMVYLIPESDVKILEFNRLVRDLNDLTKEEFLIQLDAIFRIENRGQVVYKPSKRHHFTMYLDGEFYSLYLRKNQFIIDSSLDDLDAYILYKTILKPILGIDDLRKDTRISYINGKRDIADLKYEVDSGRYEVGFGMIPADITQMKKIADEGLTMPPKSTYIEPKLRSGITIYEF
ncbi:Uncharacterized conserved protein, DUF1015 family [Flavobacteriaceae bacterium MAR_2010_188]|nr:Uncharacterized conserved protein, DUF1015 family [Flavobacteriaceae bacterium MAR_2010_188]